jgi:hypothetical protein
VTDYPVGVVVNTVRPAIHPTTPDWYEDNDPTTVAAFHTAGLVNDNGIDFSLHGDLTAIPGIIGWRIEVEIVSGVGQLAWTIEFDDDDTFGYVAFQDFINVTGPGTFVNIVGDPYFVSSAGGHTYTGIYDLIARMSNEVGYAHSFGELEIGPVVSGDDIVVSEFRVIFFTADTATAIRLWPRDDSRGINAVTRVYPQPRAGRVVGGQP